MFGIYPETDPRRMMLKIAATAPWPAIVNLAYNCAHAFGVGSPGDKRLAGLAPGTLERLNLKLDVLTSLAIEMKMELDAAGELFDRATPESERQAGPPVSP